MRGQPNLSSAWRIRWCARALWEWPPPAEFGALLCTPSGNSHGAKFPRRAQVQPLRRGRQSVCTMHCRLLSHSCPRAPPANAYRRARIACALHAWVFCALLSSHRSLTSLENSSTPGRYRRLFGGPARTPAPGSRSAGLGRARLGQATGCRRGGSAIRRRSSSCCFRERSQRQAALPQRSPPVRALQLRPGTRMRPVRVWGVRSSCALC